MYKRQVLLDSKADLLLYGNAERAIVDITHRFARGETPKDMKDVRGIAFATSTILNGWKELDLHDIDNHEISLVSPKKTDKRTVIRLPSYEQVSEDPETYAHASRLLHIESNPGNARPLIQKHGNRNVWVTEPPIPLTTKEMDGVFALPYARAPHPVYGEAKIPAWEMIRFSVNIMRGCFGGCSFCSITEHEDRIIQSRSEESILKEIEDIRDQVPGFTGVISDVGGPTANMYRMACKDKKIEAICRKPSCVFPDICKNLNTDHKPLIELYRKARKIDGVKKY